MAMAATTHDDRRGPTKRAEPERPDHGADVTQPLPGRVVLDINDRIGDSFE